jgi:hypothetical protein
MRGRLKQGGLAAVLLALLGGAIVSAQDPPITVGGVFDTFRSYVVMGSWTFRNTVAPLVIQPWGNLYGTTVTTLASATARTWTLPDATDTSVGLATTDTLTNKTLTAPVLGGSVTGTYTLAGTLTTIAAPTVTGTMTLTATTNQLILGTTNTTRLTAPAPAASLTLTIPNAGSSNAAAIPAHFDCGSTGTGSQTCAPAAVAATSKVYSGRSTLASNAATITFAPAFTSSTSFECVANDVTTRANVVQMVPASGSTATITNTTGASDVIQWICVGQ